MFLISIITNLHNPLRKMSNEQKDINYLNLWFYVFVSSFLLIAAVPIFCFVFNISPQFVSEIYWLPARFILVYLAPGSFFYSYLRLFQYFLIPLLSSILYALDLSLIIIITIWIFHDFLFRT